MKMSALSFFDDDDAWALLQCKTNIKNKIILNKNETHFYLKANGKQDSFLTVSPTSKKKKLFSIKRTPSPVTLQLHSNIDFQVDDEDLFGSFTFLAGEHSLTIGKKMKLFFYLIDNEFPEKPIVVDYKVLSCIGEGSFSFVYKCINTKKGTVKALKWMKKDPDDIEERLEMFKNEHRILSKISHLNIVRLDNFVNVNNELTFFELEYFPGEDLQERVSNPGRTLSAANIKIVFYQVITALEFLHRAEIIHRDVKPGNIFLIDKLNSCVAKLGDFGISLDTKITDEAVYVAGSKLYTSPEVILFWQGDEKFKYTPAVDVWGYAVSLYFAIYGRLPFGSASDFDSYISKVLDFSPDFGGDGPRKADIRIQALLMHILRSSPNERLTSEQVLKSEWFQKDTRMLETVQKLLSEP